MQPKRVETVLYYVMEMLMLVYSSTEFVSVKRICYYNRDFMLYIECSLFLDDLLNCLV